MKYNRDNCKTSGFAGYAGILPAFFNKMRAGRPRSHGFCNYLLIIILIIPSVSCRDSRDRRFNPPQIRGDGAGNKPGVPELKSSEGRKPYRPRIVVQGSGRERSIRISDIIDNRQSQGETVVNRRLQDLIASVDYNDATVRNRAVQLAGQSPGNFNIGQISNIFDFALKSWNYVNDPKGNDYFANASETLKNGLNGDCDDFAILVCAMILAIGGEARIVFAYGKEGGHAFAEVMIDQSNISGTVDYLRKRYKITGPVWHRTDKQGNNWLNLDWFDPYPGGRYYDYNHGTTFYIRQNYSESFTR